jgi:hypothetical protein
VIDDEILRDFGSIWPRHVSSLTQFLIDCRKHFDGDIDLFLVLCVIGDRTFSEQHAPSDMDFGTWSSASVSHVRSIEINVQSLSDYSGIPRETVRRKLIILVDKGWVARDERGFITATDKAKEDLAPLTTVSLGYLSRMKAVLSGA